MRDSLRAVRPLGVFLLACLTTVLAHTSSANDSDAMVKLWTLPDTERTYLLATPQNQQHEKPRPLLIMLHGGMGNARSFLDSTGLVPLAVEADWLVALPNGAAGPARSPDRRTWNAGLCCGRAARTNSKDQLFIENMIDHIATKQSIDRNQIYVVGFSNGGMMAYSMACDASSPVRAIAVVGASLVSETCSHPSSKVAIFALHGDDDQSVPFAGGKGSRTRTRLHYRSVLDSLATFARPRKCKRTGPNLLPDGDRGWNWRCKAGAPIELRVFKQTGHRWPSSASAMIVDFFSRLNQSPKSH
ncbi:MAG: hypothetical protein CBC48_17700 [bacterium TMED88]|nr:hypothetical protein [Deltaproteobacteria bacterium]OUV24276.1 MAG: hypothetical protein CBC48_17700 [bacterium TMED88]